MFQLLERCVKGREVTTDYRLKNNQVKLPQKQLLMER